MFGVTGNVESVALREYVARHRDASAPEALDRLSLDPSRTLMSSVRYSTTKMSAERSTPVREAKMMMSSSSDDSTGLPPTR